MRQDSQGCPGTLLRATLAQGRAQDKDSGTWCGKHKEGFVPPSLFSNGRGQTAHRCATISSTAS